jgi:hypothetical protein
MISRRERERARNTALAQTILACLVAEGLGLFVFRQFSADLLEAALRSAIWLGPLSLWIARPIYRRLLRSKLKADRLKSLAA